MHRTEKKSKRLLQHNNNETEQRKYSSRLGSKLQQVALELVLLVLRVAVHHLVGVAVELASDGHDYVKVGLFAQLQHLQVKEGVCVRRKFNCSEERVTHARGASAFSTAASPDPPCACVFFAPLSLATLALLLGHAHTREEPAPCAPAPG